MEHLPEHIHQEVKELLQDFQAIVESGEITYSVAEAFCMGQVFSVTINAHDGNMYDLLVIATFVVTSEGYTLHETGVIENMAAFNEAFIALTLNLGG